jgi:hypothetical protein
LVAGLIRGDGDTAILPLASACPLLDSGEVVALAANVVPVVGTDCRKYLASVPTIADLAKTYGKNKKAKSLFSAATPLLGASGVPTATQTSVAGYKVDALRTALAWVYKQSSFKIQMETSGVNPKYVDPVKAKLQYETGVTDGTKIACYLAPGFTCTT